MRQLRIFPVLAAATFALTICDVMTGPAMLGASDVLGALFAPSAASANVAVIVREMRLPVALMAVVVGAALGLSGAVMQTILHNPLASPYTLGVGAGASLGASAAIILGLGNIGISSMAFAFAMSVCVVIALVGRGQRGSSSIVLAGIAMLFLFQSAQAMLQYGASETQNQSIVFWAFGSLQRTTWQRLAAAAAISAAAAPFVIADAWRYSALTLGDEHASSLGINVSMLRAKAFFLVSLLAAAAVCFTGTIGFIGLAGPHIARAIAGDDQRLSMPLSALCGAVLLSAASIASKTIRPGLIYPIGMITSVIGVPFFFVIVMRARRHGE